MSSNVAALSVLYPGSANRERVPTWNSFAAAASARRFSCASQRMCLVQTLISDELRPAGVCWNSAGFHCEDLTIKTFACCGRERCSIQLTSVSTGKALAVKAHGTVSQRALHKYGPDRQVLAANPSKMLGPCRRHPAAGDHEQAAPLGRPWGDT